MNYIPQIGDLIVDKDLSKFTVDKSKSYGFVLYYVLSMKRTGSRIDYIFHCYSKSVNKQINFMAQIDNQDNWLNHKDLIFHKAKNDHEFS